jgi:hypothetical protein
MLPKNTQAKQGIDFRKTDIGGIPCHAGFRVRLVRCTDRLPAGTHFSTLIDRIVFPSSPWAIFAKGSPSNNTINEFQKP